MASSGALKKMWQSGDASTVVMASRLCYPMNLVIAVGKHAIITTAIVITPIQLNNINTDLI